MLDDLLFRQGKYKKIVLVCHSLGGILCRSHLLHVKLRWGHAYLSLFPASFTFGTPLLGAHIANFLRVSANAEARALTPAEANDYLQLLMNSTEEFNEKRETLGCPELLFYAGYEQQKTPASNSLPHVKVLVVPKESATAGVPDGRIKGFPKDHRQMVKPADRTDDAYRWVRDVLKACRSNDESCGKPVQAYCGRPPWLRLP
jgi:hypothetical protein